MAMPSSFQPVRAAPRAASDPGMELIESTSCGRSVLWLSVLRKMGLRDVINRLLPTESEVSHGDVVEALVLNRLLAPRPLYRIDEWARACALGTLTGLDPARLNDDRVGRTLDALAGAERDCQAAVSVRVFFFIDTATTE